MTLIVAEGFDGTTSSDNTNLMAIVWSRDTVNSWINVTDRYPDSQGAGIVQLQNGLGYLTYSIPAAFLDSTVIAGLAVIMKDNNDGIGTYRKLMQIKDASANVRATVWLVSVSNVTVSKKIEVRAGSLISGTLLASSVVAVVDNASWYYIEIKYTCHASAGAIELRCNELTIANVSGIDTTGGVAGTTIGQFQIGAPSNASPTNGLWWMDDFYLCNNDGSVNNDFLGDVRVVRLYANGAGSVSDWTPTGNSNHYENVNDHPPTAAAYNSSGTDEQAENYTLDDLPATATGTIFGICQRMVAWCTALNVGIAATIADSTTETERSELALDTTAGISASSSFHFTDEAKPSGGLWTTSEVNAMKIGQKIKSIT